MILNRQNPRKFKLVFVRHGQSVWNLENRFTGWQDVDLTDLGIQESIKAGKLLKLANINFDISYSSILKRAIKTHHYIFSELKSLHVPVMRSWRLNERHYGALTGLFKEETAKKLGETLVKTWRKSFTTPPPEMEDNHPFHTLLNPVFSKIPKAIIPKTESIKTTLERAAPLLYDTILPNIMQGKNVLVVAHANSIRSIMKVLDNICDEKIADMSLENGVPYVYEMDHNLNILKKTVLKTEEEASSYSH